MSANANHISSPTDETASSRLCRRAAVATAKVSRCVPTTAKDGFDQGRRYGRRFVEHDAVYAAGAAVGFTYGAVETVVGIVAAPTNCAVTAAPP